MSINELYEILKQLQIIAENVAASEFGVIPGNSREFVYYTGIESGNPSGSVDNVKTIVYKKGGVTVATQSFFYDASNRVTVITTA